jgi:hypothetical protein
MANTLLDLRDPEGLVMIGVGQGLQGDTQESQRNLLRAIGADPSNHAGRYALLRPWLGRLARGEAPPQRIRETLETIDGSAAVAIQAWLAGSVGSWDEVQMLDEQLAAVLPTDLWYLDSVMLRADWRVNAPADQQPDAAREAIRLIDEAIAIYQDPDFYSMRLAAAYVAESMPELIETARRLIHIFNNEINLAEDGEVNPTFAELQVKATHVGAVAQILTEIEGDERIEPYKVAELKGSIERIKDRLRALAASP